MLREAQLVSDVEESVVWSKMEGVSLRCMEGLSASSRERL